VAMPHLLHQQQQWRYRCLTCFINNSSGGSDASPASSTTAVEVAMPHLLHQQQQWG
jgi:hypothetical protein